MRYVILTVVVLAVSGCGRDRVARQKEAEQKAEQRMFDRLIVAQEEKERQSKEKSEQEREALKKAKEEMAQELLAKKKEADEAQDKAKKAQDNLVNERKKLIEEFEVATKRAISPLEKEVKDLGVRVKRFEEGIRPSQWKEPPKPVPRSVTPQRPRTSMAYQWGINPNLGESSAPRRPKEEVFKELIALNADIRAMERERAERLGQMIKELREFNRHNFCKPQIVRVSGSVYPNRKLTDEQREALLKRYCPISKQQEAVILEEQRQIRDEIFQLWNEYQRELEIKVARRLVLIDEAKKSR